jgi:chloramphenicol O-acetyltransferase
LGFLFFLKNFLVKKYYIFFTKFLGFFYYLKKLYITTMKRKEKEIKNISNISFFSNKLIRENNSMNRIIEIANSIDHEQRLLMDGVTRMVEAMIDGQSDIAEMYSKSHPELESYYHELSTMTLEQLVEVRINNPGYDPRD